MNALRSSLLLAVGLVCTAACATEAEDTEADQASALEQGGLLAALETNLQANNAASKGSMWKVSSGRLDGQWMLQVPATPLWGKKTSDYHVPDECTPAAGDARCDADFRVRTCNTQSDCGGTSRCQVLKATIRKAGDKARGLCLGDADPILDDAYALITSAEHQVDIATLGTIDGRFEAAFRNAFTILAAKPSPPRVRVLLGNFWGSGVDENVALASLVRDVPAGSKMIVQVANHWASQTSWNHSKFIAVDGKSAAVGGMNWGAASNYLSKMPVADFTMRLDGEAAGGVHAFADALWTDECGWWRPRIAKRGTTTCAEKAVLPKASGAKGPVPMITVGRLGAADASQRASDTALRTLFDESRSVVRIMQMDLFPYSVAGVSPTGWGTIREDLVRTLGRGVHVCAVISNVGSQGGGQGGALNGYSTGWTPEQVHGEVVKFAKRRPELVKDGVDVGKNFHVASLRIGPEATWPGGMPFAFHPKMMISDARGFYVGSHNLYPADLAELGVVVADGASTSALLSKYWNAVWDNSKATLASDAAPICHF